MRVHILKKAAIAMMAFITLGGEAFAANFDIVTAEVKASIYYDKECKLDSIAANLLASDIELVTGYRPFTSSDILQANGNVIIIGSVNARIMGQFRSRANLEALKGKWETYAYRLIVTPSTNIKNVLIISGSDFRGTAYGVFDLSARLGISPWYWWADVSPAKRKDLSINIEPYTSAPPAVKFRGIFINDEDWGLQPWAAKTFEPETKDIGPKTYARVFELLLRLKANLIWPAMHPSTQAFFHYPGNVTTAGDYQIVIGSSHAEPMLRNNVSEWDVKTMGHFNYFTNKEKIYKYWEDRVKESKGINAIYSLGMRGVHDGQMEGIKNLKEAVPVVEQIIKDQRKMLSTYLNKDISFIPQVLTPYKEVLEIYDYGLKVPEDVTLVWPDDNYGYISRLNNEKEQARKGGAGVYYHASYWGRPHDYLWLPSVHPSLQREEMIKAYETGASRLWVLNVGDIKPQENNLQQFLDIAYNPAPFKDSKYTRQHMQNWIGSIFGGDRAEEITQILWEYYQLAFERKPEFMGWSQTEPETKTKYTEFNHFYYGDEAQRRIDRYIAIEAAVKKLRDEVAPRDAFYQLIYYPVVGAAFINKKFLYRDDAYFYGKQNRLSAGDFAQFSKACYDSIVKETEYYNTELAGGKWKYVMSMNPRNLDVYREPALPAITIDSTDNWSIAPEGFVTKDSSLLADGAAWIFDNLNKQKYFVDLYLIRTQPVRWKVIPSANWIRVSEDSGELSATPGKKQTRIWVEIDWSKVGSLGVTAGSITFTDGSKQLEVKVQANKRDSNGLSAYNGFIENNGFVAMDAAHFNRQNNQGANQWKIIDDFGYTGNTLQAFPLSIKSRSLSDPDSIKRNNAVAEYDFYTFSTASPQVTMFAIPTHPLNDNFKVRYAVAIDDGPLKIADIKTFGRSEEWKQNVLRNRAERRIDFSSIGPGKHTLKVYVVDPGVILDEIRIDLGGLKKAYSALAETRIKK